MGKGKDSKGQDGAWGYFLKALPLGKLSKYQVVNLLWEIPALYFTLQFTVHHNVALFDYLAWIAIIVLTFVCVLWASNQ